MMWLDYKKFTNRFDYHYYIKIELKRYALSAFEMCTYLSG